MKINPNLVEYIRTMVRGDDAENDRIEAELDREGWDDFPKLLAAVFFFAVDRRFNGEASPAEVIQFVAEMRVAAPIAPDVIDANAAELLIRSALDPTIGNDVEPGMTGRIQVLTIRHLLGGTRVTDQALTALLNESVQLAGRL